MANILIYKRSVFNVSETFIYKQVMALAQNNKVVVVARKVIDNFPVNNFKVVRVEKSMLVFIQLYWIIKKNKISVIHAHFGPDALDVLKVAKFTNTKLVVSFHGYDASSKLRNNIYKSQLPGLFKYTSIVIVCSRHMINSLGLQNQQHKVRYVPYGIDADFFKPSGESKEDNAAVKILHSGRMVEKKGVLDLIIVFNNLQLQYANIQLHIVGGGELFEQSKALAGNLKIPTEKIIFYSAQPSHKVKIFMDKADIFVLNSRVASDGNMEGLPNSILEAMSMEKAVVSTYHAGIPDVISNDNNGLLVKENDNNGLQKAIGELVVDKAKRIQLGKKARETVLEKFTEQKMQQSLQQIFAEL